VILVERIVVNGGNKLYGEVNVQGSKNSSLPILAATVLVKGVSVIHNCPDLSDVNAAVSILRHLGCLVKRENNTLIVDSSCVSCYNVPDCLMREMRSSIVFLGSVLGRTGKAVLSSSDSILILSTSSPDGSFEFNRNLAKKRAANTSRLLQEMFPAFSSSNV
jgi:UDP-N-acetylglucosamine enolpyruvyl transferase